MAIILTGMSTATRAGTINVPAGGDLQSALNMAVGGDEIVLEAGAVFTGNFTLPVKTGDQYITIRSSRLAELPAGRRVTPADAALMPRLQTPNAGPVFVAPPSAHHYRLLGLNLTQSGSFLTYGLVELGDGNTAGPQNSFEKVPHHFSIERCYLHAFDGLAPLKRGIVLNSAYTDVLDTHISGVKVVGQDTQAIGGWNGSGPFRIENNYLEAAGENILFGGAVPGVPFLVASDIVVRHNHFRKPLEWKPGDPSYAGTAWSVKNLFELKSARRVLIEGNLFENNWAQSQSGFAIVLTVGNDSGSWAQVEDVTFQNNIVRNSEHGFNIRARDDVAGSGLRRLMIRNNLVEGINTMFMQVLRGVEGLTVEHNTALHGGTVVMFDGGASEYNEPVRFANNVMRHNAYGVFGSGGFIGTGALEKYCRNWAFTGNIVAGAAAAQYPVNNLYPATLDGLFADPANGNYRIINPKLKGRGTDGKDPGCDFDELVSALAGHYDMHGRSR